MCSTAASDVLTRTTSHWAQTEFGSFEKKEIFLFLQTFLLFAERDIFGSFLFIALAHVVNGSLRRSLLAFWQSWQSPKQNMQSCLFSFRFKAMDHLCWPPMPSNRTSELWCSRLNGLNFLFFWCHFRLSIINQLNQQLIKPPPQDYLCACCRIPCEKCEGRTLLWALPIRKNHPVISPAKLCLVLRFLEIQRSRWIPRF